MGYSAQSRRGRREVKGATRRAYPARKVSLAPDPRRCPHLQVLCVSPGFPNPRWRRLCGSSTAGRGEGTLEWRRGADVPAKPGRCRCACSWQRTPQNQNADRYRSSKARLPGPCPLRTGRADLPHPALRSVVLPQREPTDLPARPAIDPTARARRKKTHSSLAPLPGPSAGLQSTPRLRPPLTGCFSTLYSLAPLTVVDYLPPTPHELLHLPGSLRSTGITQLPHYYGPSDS